MLGALPRMRSVVAPPTIPRPPFSVPVPGVRSLVPPVTLIAAARTVVLPPLKPPEMVPVLVMARFAPDMPAPPWPAAPAVPPFAAPPSPPFPPVIWPVLVPVLP
ncbi:hypothetical protein MMR14E_02085 [Methylobacterium mesophilicum]